jgi:hypothetical protein
MKSKLGLPILVIAGVLTGVIVRSQLAPAAPTPQLGGPSPRLAGFGVVRPAEIYLGGDPTSRVTHIHWKHWGSSEASGSGESVWVWPGTCTGCNRPTSARVVAFKLGSCHGRPSYNAVEWYFPQYGDVFNRSNYIQTCTPTGTQVSDEPVPMPTSCPESPLVGGGRATEMSVEHMSCETASQLIAGLPAGPFRTERRFEHWGFRCGDEGSTDFPNLVQCARGRESVIYTATY